ncbi:hypothetical protein PXO_04294 [Xanthomonas oryzae pv. oryzae PXO99A]|uniref:Uncharacterized protein n=1 Tax=Xanthomonas oryzae pv. oryzae (strain PXO99A) TaxID=360094 RepID=A0A0K0GH74_XANOP|nr:hypothetical protein PXO_04294 [Xanthomonas oryzae pv. oryzae PXO99A]
MHASIDDISVLPVSPLLARLRAAAPSLQRRVPLQADASRWHALRIGARTYLAALPITFTPYASVRPCAVRCGFCSENLRQHGSMAAWQHGSMAAVVRQRRCDLGLRMSSR